MRITSALVLFFRKSIFGNWVRVPGGISMRIGDNIVKLPTSEHVFMALKALHFKDYSTLDQIIKTDSPKEAKKLGRLVKGFNEEDWEKERENAMWQAIKLRYIYDSSFRVELMRPDYIGKEFVECNPYDFIWGCGWEEDSPQALNPLYWKGLNLLGKLLTRLRDECCSGN